MFKFCSSRSSFGSRLEHDQRLPDLETLAALFVPALGLEDEPETIARLLELAAAARSQASPATGKITVTQSVEVEVSEIVEARLEEMPRHNLPFPLTSFMGREADLKAAETVCDSRLEASSVHRQAEIVSILDLLTQLVNKSLVVVERKPGTAVRYRLLETIRFFAWQKLEEAGETAVIRQRHFDFFYDLAQQAALFGAGIERWLNLLEPELDNLRAALTSQLANEPGDGFPPLAARAESALQMLLPLLDFYWYRGYVVETQEWLSWLLAAEMPSSAVRSAGFQKAGWLARTSGNYDLVVTLLNQALAIAREIEVMGGRRHCGEQRSSCAAYWASLLILRANYFYFLNAGSRAGIGHGHF